MHASLSRLSRIGLIFLAACLGSSCLIVSKESLIEPSKSKTDARLIGRWVGTDKLADVYALFKQGTVLESNIIAGKEPVKESELMFDYFTGSIGKHQYMSLKMRDDPATDGYLLARYVIEGDELKIWLLDSTLIDAAISHGKLKSDKAGSSSTTLTDPRKKILAFIVAHEDSKDLFEFLGAFKRAAK